MNESPYSNMIKTEAEANNGDLGFLVTKYSSLIGKTEITYWSERHNSTIKYYDPVGLVIYEAHGNPDNFPVLGIKKEVAGRKTYQKTYDKANTVSFTVKLTNKDQDLIDFVKNQKNRNELFKRLLRDELKKQQNESNAAGGIL